MATNGLAWWTVLSLRQDQGLPLPVAGLTFPGNCLVHGHIPSPAACWKEDTRPVLDSTAYLIPGSKGNILKVSHEPLPTNFTVLPEGTMENGTLCCYRKKYMMHEPPSGLSSALVSLVPGQAQVNHVRSLFMKEAVVDSGLD